MDHSDTTQQTNDLNSQFARHWVPVQPGIMGMITAAIRNRHDAEDVLQEVAATAAKDYHRYDSQKPFFSWVASITKFRIVDYYRKKNRDKLVFDEEVLELIAQSAARTASLMTGQQEALDKCMQKLTPRASETLRMRYSQDLSASQIGEKQNLSESAVFSFLHRLRKGLIDCIQQNLNTDEVAK